MIMPQNATIEQVPLEQTSMNCFHCGLPVLNQGEFTDEKQTKQFCCAGCQSVASIIEAGGFERYYVMRDRLNNKPETQEAGNLKAYDNPLLQVSWVEIEGEKNKAEFLIDGINCSACVWLIENWLVKIEGIEAAEINYSTHRLSVQWQADIIKVSEILGEIQNLGYQGQPYTREASHQLLAQQKSILLKRLGVAAALGMQIMVISVALYAGDWYGMEPSFASFLKKVNVLLTLPLLMFSAKPFFIGAWRGIKTRAPGMDLSVSLGVTLAFLGSLWATITGHGEVYFDSIAMFVFFLLAARFFEASSRLKGAQQMEPLASITPAIAQRLNKADDFSSDPHQAQAVAVAELKLGDSVLVKPGEVVPTDGRIIQGASSFDESLLTGEAKPIARKRGSLVLAGSMNIEQAVTLKVNALAQDTVLSSILKLADQAGRSKPKVSMLAERISSWFVMAIILLATMVSIYGWLQGNPDWLPITISVLVVTCPCALSLATPLALVAGANGLMQRGIYVASSRALETLNKVNHFVFDKTGTLTLGEPQLEAVYPQADFDREYCISLAAQLEQGAAHPLAKSLQLAAQDLENIKLPFVEIEHIAGKGISGMINDEKYYLGSIAFAEETLNKDWRAGLSQSEISAINLHHQQIIVLFTKAKAIAVLTFSDPLRKGVKQVLNDLKALGHKVTLISGDRVESVERLASGLGIEHVHAACSPEQKLELLDQFIKQGDVVCMVGDGINDTPAMNKAHIAIAMARNVNLAAANADIIITGESFAALTQARKMAVKTFTIIKQNISWALLYNLCAIPAALMGWVHPLLAGIGMSLSSVIVILNASRLSKKASGKGLNLNA